MKKKKACKGISLLLCAAMLCSNLSMSVSAEELQTEQNIEIESEETTALQIIEESISDAEAETTETQLPDADTASDDEFAVSVEEIEILPSDIVPLSDLSEDQGQAETPGLMSVRDNTPPVIKIEPEGMTYYCTAPTVTVTDGGGNLESIVAVSNSESIDGTVSDDGSNGVVELKDGMGSVTITAKDSSGNEISRTIYDNHSIQSIRRTDLPATCTEPLRTVSFFVCGICNEEYGHRISTLLVIDPENEGKYKEKDPAKGHDLTDVEAETVDVCGEGGEPLQLRRCKRCDKLIDNDGKVYVPDEGSAHQWSDPIKKDPTCTEPGYYYIECTKCHIQKITATYLDKKEDGTLTETAQSLRPLGHRIGEWTVVEGQTESCAAEYQQERKCTRDGCTLKETRTMKPGNHSWGNTLVILKEPTCTEVGKKGYRCQNCSATKETVDIPATGHTLKATDDCTQGGTCSVCGETMPGNSDHIWSKTIQKDSSGHWKTCSVNGCNGRTEVTPHSSKSTAFDCTKSWNCSECGYSVPGNAKHETKWVCDDEGTCHWLECVNEGCTYKGSKAVHYYGNTSSYDCTKGMVCQTCGYVKLEKKESHDYVWVSTYSNVHWMKCQNEGCTERTRYGDENYGDHVYPSVRDCTKGISCTLCGYQLFAPATEHSFSSTIYNDAEGHYQLCRNYNCSGKKYVSKHTGGTATCTQKAVCDICHQPYGEIDGQNHPDKVLRNEREATTDAPGYTGDVVCEECGTVLEKGTDIPQLPKECVHEYERISDAEKCWDRCSKCGHEKEIVFHSFTDIITEEGHQRQCVSCKYTTALMPHAPEEEDYNCATSLKCKDCGYVITPAAEHKFDSEYMVDAAGHWQECENPNCNQLSPVQAHEAQEDDGDCTTDIICKDCGYVMFVKAEEHKYSGVWESDENGHWQKCVNSGCTSFKRDGHSWAQDDKDCTTPVSCTVCGYIQTEGEAAHNFGGAYITDEDGHWQKCQNAGCEAISGENEHVGGTASCRKQAVCEICGLEYGALNPDYHAGDTELRNYREPTVEEEGYSGDLYCLGCEELLEPGVILDKLQEEHTHSYDLPGSDGTHHWKECPCGARENIEEHSFGEWKKDSIHHWHVCSDCEAIEGRGSHTYVDGACKDCGYELEVHEHKYEWKSDEKGHEQKCSDCGETANASSHTFEWHSDENAHWQVCITCGYIANRAEHTLKMQSDRTHHWIACTQDGCDYQEEKTLHEVEDDLNCATEARCKTCDTVVAAAKEHNWSPVYSCDEEGHWRECMNEGCSQRDGITAHNPVGDEKNCTADICCLDCGYIIRKGASGHDFSGTAFYTGENQAGHWKVCQNEGCTARACVEVHKLVVDASDCTKDIHCEACGYVVHPGKAAHNFGSTYTSDEKAHWLKCQNDGCKVTGTPEMHRGGKATCSSQAVCEVCKTAYGSVDASNHSWGAWKTSVPSTVLQEGTEERSCSLCSAKETRKLPLVKPTAKVNMTKVPLKVGQSTTKLKVSDLAAGDYVKSWKSSNSKVVTVSKKGKLIAKKAGKATITITLASKKKKYVKVVVQNTTVKTTKISVKSRKVSLKKRKKFDLKATVSPLTSQQGLSYTSSNSKIATVNKKGVITAKKPGKAKITVRSGSKKVIVNVTVKK